MASAAARTTLKINDRKTQTKHPRVT